jgi:hypothetical protein
MNSFHFRVPGAWPTERQIAGVSRHSEKTRGGAING